MLLFQDDSHPLYSRGFDFPVLQSEARPKTGPGVYLKYTGGWAVCCLLCFLSGLYAFSIAVAPICIVRVGEAQGEVSFILKNVKCIFKISKKKFSI